MSNGRSRRTLGVDIGGANLKLADATGRSMSVPFPMWTEHQQLGATLRQVINRFDLQFSDGGTTERLAVTMTGELADCFATRRQGVSMILDQVAIAFEESKTAVYAVGGQWLSSRDARLNPWRVAASNWYALADWLLASASFDPLEIDAIVDIGSTTIDLVPVKDGRIMTSASTDRQRLELGQLLYTGMQRTPVASILSEVTVESLRCPLMAERFATSDDAYVALGLVEEMPADCDTADGRPRTKACARARLARMIGEDMESLSGEAVHCIAQQIVDAQAQQLALAMKRNTSHVIGAKCTVCVSGHGRPLLERAVLRLPRACELLWLEERINPSASRCGPALAVAWLLEHRKE